MSDNYLETLKDTVISIKKIKPVEYPYPQFSNEILLEDQTTNFSIMKKIESENSSKYKSLLYKVKKDLENNNIKRASTILSFLGKPDLDKIIDKAKLKEELFEEYYNDALKQIGTNVPNAFRKPLAVSTALICCIKKIKVKDMIDQYKLKSWELVILASLIIGASTAILTSFHPGAIFVLLLLSITHLIIALKEFDLDIKKKKRELETSNDNDE